MAFVESIIVALGTTVPGIYLFNARRKLVCHISSQQKPSMDCSVKWRES